MLRADGRTIVAAPSYLVGDECDTRRCDRSQRGEGVDGRGDGYDCEAGKGGDVSAVTEPASEPDVGEEVDAHASGERCRGDGI